MKNPETEINDSILHYILEECRLQREYNLVRLKRTEAEDALSKLLIEKCNSILDVFELIDKWPFPSDLSNFNALLLTQKIRSFIECRSTLERLHIDCIKRYISFTIRLTGDSEDDSKAVKYLADLIYDHEFDVYVFYKNAEYELCKLRSGTYSLVPYSRFEPDLYLETNEDVVEYIYSVKDKIGGLDES